MINPDCLFCDKDDPESHTIIGQNELAYARWDNLPVNPGHAEIVPKRHFESFFDITPDELIAVHGLAVVVKKLIVAEHAPAGFTIGINDGEAAGRTIPHLHLHLIPRYNGDVPNPRGGIRNIIPEKGDY